jgi:methylmalonyl-CoA/ethylmalonyl-CoA epimerase
MSFSLSRIGQIAMAVANLDRAEAFYEGTLGLRKLYRFDDLTYFDCAGVRLLLEKAHTPENVSDASTLYFSCADITLAVRELRQRGISFSRPPHLIAKMDDHDLWMTFFEDSDGHTLALMQEAPKGYSPPAVAV